MAGFHDVKLPDDIERGAVGGPRFKTTVLSLESGFEKRNIDWQDTKGEWNIGYGVMPNELRIASEAYLQLIRSFWYARNGRAFSFRFKDWLDFEIGDVTDAVNDFVEIATAPGGVTDFQIINIYSDAANSHSRTITKIVATPTPVVLLDGVIESASNYSIDLITGIISFNTAPTAGVKVGVACEFDNHVRFDTDNFDVNADLFNLGSWSSVPIIEIRGAD